MTYSSGVVTLHLIFWDEKGISALGLAAITLKLSTLIDRGGPRGIQLAQFGTVEGKGSRAPLATAGAFRLEIDV